ncbi:MAG: hypothetical protein JKY95_04180 [Planctomycetaceae bacterium]|nr:hypothetical protein [Planctomycetaceae bacterium]
MISIYRPHPFYFAISITVVIGLLSLGCNGSDQANNDATEAPQEEAEAFRLSTPDIPDPARQDFVGSRACAECHAEIYETYTQSHPMGHSLGKVTEVSALEDYSENAQFNTAKAPRSSVTISYKIEKKDGQVLHHEIATTKEGEVIYDKPVPVEYAMGSGKRGRSYLINHSGSLFMSPVTWYSETKQWDLSPGYKSNNLHFGRRVVDGCLSCHVGRVDSVAGPSNFYKPTPFIEESISCEQCHGPGEQHIEFHHSGAEEGDDPVVNPSDLSASLRDDVCLQCHLVGEHRLTRYKRSHFDFRPGDSISDIWTIFLKKNTVAQDGSTEAVSQPEQMISSECYQKSDGQLGCISCHDPHKTPNASERIEFFRNRCIACHGPEQTECSEQLDVRKKVSSKDSCIACHMPKIDANDVPHTSQTDHRILKNIQSKKTKKQTGQEVYYIFRAEENLIPEAEVIRAEAISLINLAEQRGNSGLVIDAIAPLEKWLEVAPDDLPARISLGTGYWLAGDMRQAIRTWEKALEQAPNEENVLRRMLMLYHSIEEREQGIKYGRKVVEVNPWDFEIFGRLSHLYGQLERYEESARAGEKALELNPAATQIHQWLIEIYALMNDMERSKYHKERYELLTAP